MDTCHSAIFPASPSSVYWQNISLKVVNHFERFLIKIPSNSFYESLVDTKIRGGFCMEPILLRNFHKVLCAHTISMSTC